jgi:hypothetical protein
VLRERILHGKQVQQQFCKCFIIQWNKVNNFVFLIFLLNKIEA